MNESWKDIIGYEGLYQVSNIGNVRKIAPFSRKMDCSKQNPYLLKKSTSSTGYVHVQLVKNGKAKTINVHKLVATAFVSNPESKPEINHIDANRSNNIFTNLEWVTHAENMVHSARLLSVRKDMEKKRYTVLQYSTKGEFIKEWNSVGDIVSVYGMRRCSIYTCLSGKHKSSSGYLWIKHFHGDHIHNKIEPLQWLTGKTQKPKCRKIIQFDKQHNVVRIWDDYHQLEKDISFGRNAVANIMNCANGKRKSAYGFIWQYI